MRNLIRVVLFAIFFVIAGDSIHDSSPFFEVCGPVRTGIKESFYLDETFSDEEYEKISHALDVWRRSTGGVVNITIDGSIPHRFVSFDSQQFRPLMLSDDSFYSVYKVTETVRGHWPKEIVGYQGTIAISLLTSRMGSNNVLSEVVMHEVGHFVGLKHTLVPGSLMFPFCCLFSADEIPTTDLVELCHELRTKGKNRK
jgi:hypothetical protein